MTQDSNDIIGKKYSQSATITYEDLGYIRENSKALRCADKNKALSKYLKQIEEPQKITRLRTTQAENTQLLEKNLQRLKSVEGAISSKQFQLEQEYAWLDRVNAFRTRLLSYLPHYYHKEGEIFLNKFILENHSNEYKEVSTPPQTHHPDPNTNYLPGMNPQKQNLQDTLKRILYSKHIQKFYDEFLQTNSEYKEFEARFDITRPIEKIKKEILEQYNTDTLQEERERINKEIERLSTENEDLSQIINQTQATLALKREKFMTYYDKQTLSTDYTDETVFKAQQNNQFIGTEEQKQYLSRLMNTICEYSEIGRYIIRQSLTLGTKYILVPPNNFQQTQSTYQNGCITLPDLSATPQESDLLMTRLIYESKHALQDKNKNSATFTGISNTLLEKCIKESDALACTCAFSHDIKAIYPEIYKCILNKAPYMQRAYSSSINESKDILKALNASVIAWNKDFGESCKRTLSFYPLNHNTRPIILSPENIIEKNNITIFGIAYLDISKAYRYFLTVTDDIYTRLNIITTHTLHSNNNGMEYINRQIQRVTTQKDKYGLKICETRIIRGSKDFAIPPLKTKPHIYKNLPIRATSFTTIAEEASKGSATYRELQEYIQDKQIIFTETRGLTPQHFPIAALYNPVNNSIVINKSFTVDEQLLAVAEIILTLKSTLLPPEFRIKSQLIYTNLSYAQQITKLFALGKELTPTHPLILKKLKHEYPNIETGTPEEIFISALRNRQIRQKALNYIERELPRNNQSKATQILTIAPTEITKLFAEDLALSNHLEYIAQISASITSKDLKYLQNIAAYWQDDSISDIRIISAYEDL